MAGWLLCSKEIASLEARLPDGTPCAIDYGLARPDVAASFPPYPAAGRSGFRLTFPAGSLAESPGIRLRLAVKGGFGQRRLADARSRDQRRQDRGAPSPGRRSSLRARRPRGDPGRKPRRQTRPHPAPRHRQQVQPALRDVPFQRPGLLPPADGEDRARGVPGPVRGHRSPPALGRALVRQRAARLEPFLGNPELRRGRAPPRRSRVLHQRDADERPDPQARDRKGRRPRPALHGRSDEGDLGKDPGRSEVRTDRRQPAGARRPETTERK